MIPKDILKQIQRIQITTSRMVSDVFAGQYHSVFKGKGIEFDEVREYFPGDDIRSIDWNVTARMGHPYIKKFVEERELTVMILLDMSRSSYFGTVNKLKRQLAAEICSVLALSALKNNDKVGFIGFTDKIELFVPPRKGLRHILRIVREALYFKPKAKGTNIPQAIEYLNKVTSRRTVSFIISDFYATDFKKALSVSNKRHDVVALTITDPREITLPRLGIVEFSDAETDKRVVVDTSDQNFQKNYTAQALERFDARKKLFQSINVDTVDIRTDIPYVRSLFTFFRMRGRRMR
jgi:uncharacterized protein (DUF58 family)